MGSTKGINGKGLYAKGEYSEAIKSLFRKRDKSYRYAYKSLFLLKKLAEDNNVDISAFPIEQRLGNRYFYDKVETIENIGQVYMYDIEVENTHSFMANGFVAHNSQGMTLDKVFIDFDRVFADGQAYVALSRVKSLDGLYLKHFNASKIFANDEVKNFYSIIK